MTHTALSLREIELLVSAAAVPMLVADYTPILERYGHCTVERISELLADDDELNSCTVLPHTLGVSREWHRLYGSDAGPEAPDLLSRKFDAGEYPELRKALVAQFLAPFQGVTSLRSEHCAPTMSGDVIVRSHWKATLRDGVPDYSRIVVIDIDVSDLRSAERSLEETLESKDRLIASISHELRNPLAAALGFISVLNTDWEIMDEDARRSLAADVSEQVGDVAAMVEDLLTLYGGRTIQVSDDVLQLGAVFDGVDCGSIGVDIQEDLRVSGDQLRIRQIIRNLIRNSVVHGGSDRMLVSRTDTDHITIEVVDNGSGVPDDVAARLFEPFSHGGRAGSTGLGLSVARGLARAMGGDLRYERRDGWTVFALELRTP